MTIVRRAQIRPGVQGTDTTVKSAQGPFRALAPTWDMVMGYKNKTLSEAAYTKQYQAILQRVPDQVWETLAAQPEVLLLCYCRDGWFCHTHLIIEHLIERWPERFIDGRAKAERF
jgi:uncharacterized protein YeaO (DUF488 family)